MNITGTTKLICLLGHPVAHSLSPMMHNMACDILGLDYVYVCHDVAEDGIRDAIGALNALGYRGCNITMPGKIEAFKMCQKLTRVAKLSGSVNTVIFRDGKILGHSTDGIGYLNSLRKAGVDPKGKRLAILGSGGAARAIAAQAALDGAREIKILRRRTNEDAFREAVDFSSLLVRETSVMCGVFDMGDMAALKFQLSESDILVNATSVGMAPSVDGCLIPDPSYLPEEMVVSDIIYNPLETRLMRMAKKKRLKVTGGLSMLLYQGAASFELFTGKKMPVDAVGEAIGV